MEAKQVKTDSCSSCLTKQAGSAGKSSLRSTSSEFPQIAENILYIHNFEDSIRMSMRVFKTNASSATLLKLVTPATERISVIQSAPIVIYFI